MALASAGVSVQAAAEVMGAGLDVIVFRRPFSGCKAAVMALGVAGLGCFMVHLLGRAPIFQSVLP